MVILSVFIFIFLLTVFIGKRVNKINYLSYLFVGILTAIEVVLILYLLVTMEVPKL